MRVATVTLTTSLFLLACDVTKSVGGDEGTTGGPASVTVTESLSASASGPVATSASTSGDGTSAGVTTGGPASCVPFDQGPAQDPLSGYSWQCYCQGCTLSYEDIPRASLDLFEDQALCGCLCAQAGCGGLEGEGGVGSGFESATSVATDTAPPDVTTSSGSGGSSSAGVSDTDATTG